MSEIRTTDIDTSGQQWLMLAVAREPDIAELWQDALDLIDIESEIRLEDAVITGRSSATTYANGPGVDQLFAFALWVLAADRENAAAALIDAGWDGRHGQSRPSSMSAAYVVRGTLIALALSALLVTALVKATAG